MRFVLLGHIWDCLVAILGAKRAELVQKFMHVVASEFFATYAPDPPPLDPKLMFLCLSYYLGAFGTLNSLSLKWVKLVEKFVTRSHVRIFRNERTRSTPMDRKLIFLCISYYLGAFGTVLLPYETRCKTGRTSAKVCDTKSRRNFS